VTHRIRVEKQMSAVSDRQKIVILGGGVSALTTAYFLTQAPDWRERFESITVYQLGWRLGGKGASGRGVNGRIEEHGLHVWMGFYENAFAMIRQVYGELGRPAGSPLATWEDAFKRHNYIVIGDHGGGEWKNWIFDFEPDDCLPGDGHELPTLWDFIHLVLGFMYRNLASWCAEKGVCPVATPAEHEEALGWAHHLFEGLRADLKTGEAALSASLLLAALTLAECLPRDWTEHQAEQHSAIAALLDRFIDRLAAELREPMAADDDARRVFTLLDLGAATVRGLLRDGVLYASAGLDVLDQWDMRQWFTRHGASEASVNSNPVQAMYDLLFAYENGEVSRPNLGAGAGLRFALRMVFTYRGAIFWKMQAGMGDTIFAPLYEALKQRDVQFRFFHRVKSLALDSARRSIAAIALGRQVTTADDYDPLVEIQGLPCWPAEPRYEQIAEGDRLRAAGANLESFWSTWEDIEDITLEAGRDFDAVVLGISLGSLQFLCGDLIQADPRWQGMVANVQTVRTMAMQLWLRPDLAGLGWSLPSPVMDAYVEPMNTWADMSQLIIREAWPADQPVGNIAYFCGPMAGGIPPEYEAGFPEEALKAVASVSREWLLGNIGRLWPLVAPPQDPERIWQALASAPSGNPSVSQFYRANIDPSERYVLSVAQSLEHRLWPGDSGFANLYLAGDWTYNGINSGCVEAAVMSGMLCANALCGTPALDQIVGLHGSHGGSLPDSAAEGK
jgi:uncharacterized protein with NAD-binding domain and iron-sulfur cluster